MAPAGAVWRENQSIEGTVAFRRRSLSAPCERGPADPARIDHAPHEAADRSARRECPSLPPRGRRGGRVVAFDREARVIETAKARALAAGYRQIEFVVASDQAFPERPAFDAAIGRYVLHHQPDPVTTIRRAARAVRRGGVVAFHEPAGHVSAHILPAVNLYVELEQCLSSVFNAMLPHRDVGGRLIACFEEAGLPTPHLIWESIAGGHASPLWRLLAMTYQSMLPQIERLRMVPADGGDPDTLADRLAAAAAALRAQIVSKPQSCGWAVRS